MAHGRRIIIEAVPQSGQRYDTQGDFFVNEDGDIVVRVTGLDVLQNEAFLIAIHELVELKLCTDQGVTFQAIDDFDMAFEGEGEPGDAWNSPYRRQHRKAMLIEHLMADFLGLTGYGEVS